MDPYNPIIAAHVAAAGAPRARWAARIDAAPPTFWLALQLLALWPALWWTARRVADGSDDPLGLVALSLLAMAAVGGRLVLVDAPCSGVQLAWFAYCAASAAALWQGVPDRRFLRRLPWVGLAALLGNALRNTVLVAVEGGLLAWPAWTHDATGLVVLVAVCAIVVRLMAAEPADAR